MTPLRIKELSPLNRDLALHRQTEQGKDSDVHMYLNQAFDWYRTSEGHPFWWRICYPDTPYPFHHVRNLELEDDQIIR